MLLNPCLNLLVSISLNSNMIIVKCNYVTTDSLINDAVLSLFSSIIKMKEVAVKQDLGYRLLAVCQESNSVRKKSNFMARGVSLSLPSKKKGFH